MATGSYYLGHMCVCERERLCGCVVYILYSCGILYLGLHWKHLLTNQCCMYVLTFGLIAQYATGW